MYYFHRICSTHHAFKVFRAILKSEILKEAIAELSELPGASTIRVRVSPASPYFHLSAAGHHGHLEIAFSKHSEVSHRWTFIL